MLLLVCYVIQLAQEPERKISSTLTTSTISLAALSFREKFVFCRPRFLGMHYYYYYYLVSITIITSTRRYCGSCLKSKALVLDIALLNEAQ